MGGDARKVDFPGGCRNADESFVDLKNNIELCALKYMSQEEAMEYMQSLRIEPLMIRSFRRSNTSQALMSQIDRFNLLLDRQLELMRQSSSHKTAESPEEVSSKIQVPDEHASQPESDMNDERGPNQEVMQTQMPNQQQQQVPQTQTQTPNQQQPQVPQTQPPNEQKPQALATMPENPFGSGNVLQIGLKADDLQQQTPENIGTQQMQQHDGVVPSQTPCEGGGADLLGHVPDTDNQQQEQQQ